MTDVIKVYKGDTQEVVAMFEAGTPEGVMWQTMLPNAGRKGSLRDSEGVWLTRNRKNAARGSYHFYETKAGGQACTCLPSPAASSTICRLLEQDSGIWGGACRI